MVKKFWIVTPSYNQAGWLRQCIASVRDQVGSGASGIAVHHHVQDAHSSDDTASLLEDSVHAQRPKKGYTFSYSIEQDQGMYDAINRGWQQATADIDIIGHLNCDEQYLPDALTRIAHEFEPSPTNHVVLAALIVTNDQGNYICHRRSVQPVKLLSRFCCAGFTAATFQSADLVRKKNILFDTSWKNIGDKVWYNALHDAGAEFSVLHEVVSAFTDTGANLNWTESSAEERRRYARAHQWRWAGGSAVVARVNALRRWWLERVHTQPGSYAIFTRESPDQRVKFVIEKPTGHWHKQWPRFPASV